VLPELLQLPPDWPAIDLSQLTAPNEWQGDQPGRVLVGVYYFTTGDSYPATDSAGTPLTDNGYSITPTNCLAP